MDINKLNYEAYVIDYIEGQMNAEDKAAFDAFLRANPMIKEEIEDYLESPKISEDTDVIYERKDQSRKRRSLLLPWLSIILVGIIGITYFAIQNPNSSDNKLEHSQSKKEYNHIKQQKINQPELEHSQSEKLHQSNSKSDKEYQNLPPMANQENILDTKKNNGVYQQANNILKSKKNIIQKTKTTAEIIVNSTESIATRSTHNTNNSSPASKVISNPAVASVDSKETTITKPLITREPIENIASIQKLDQKGLYLLAEKNRRIEMIVSVNKKDRKSSNWKNLFIPQSYEDIKISNSFAPENLKSAVREVKEAFIPESLITK